jgi:hypothetical protein
MTDLFARDVLPVFEANRAAWLAEARQWARKIAKQRGEVTIDDVREFYPPPAGVDPRVMGAIMRAPEFEAVGYRKSTRATCHNRPIAIFRLAQKAQK